MTAELWFLTGSQSLYGQETLDQVAEQSQDIAARLDAQDDVPVPVVWKPTLLDAESILRQMLEADAAPECVGVIAWMHTFSPAKMWIAGLNALTKPLLHLHTQAGMELPWDTIDMDFMNLNQAAHGDREFGFIQSRLGVPRKTVAGHVDSPSVARRVGEWARAALGAAELRSLRLARFGDNMRDVAVTEGDKVQAQATFGVSVNTYAVNDLVAEVEASEEPDVDELVAEYADLYDVAAELLPGGERHESLRDGARIELGLRAFLERGRFGAFTTNFEDLGGLRQLPGLAVQRLMADGYGFGGEGDWKTAVLLRTMKTMAHGLPGGTSFMEDYTYHLVPGEERILGAHMLEVCPTITSARPSLEIHPLSIGAREDPVRLRFVADGGAGLRGRDVGHGGPLPDHAQRDRGRRSRPRSPPATRRVCRVEATSLAGDLRRVVADGRRSPSHRPHQGVAEGCDGGPRDDHRRRAGGHRRRDHHRRRSPASCAGTPRTTASPRGSEVHPGTRRYRAQVREGVAPTSGV